MSRPDRHTGRWPEHVPASVAGNAVDHEHNNRSAGQNRPAPDAPADGADNQGGARRASLNYHREIGTEQDA